MKEFILYVCYRACTGYESFSNSSSSIFLRGKILIANLFFLHMIQIGLLTADKIKLPAGEVKMYSLFIMIGLYVIIFIGSEALFSKKVLARSIALYKNHSINSFAKFIAFGYFFLNIAIIILIMYLRR